MGSGGSEKFQYFYHPDHLGSTSYITDASGEVYQHLEYFAFGGTFVEEHSNTDRVPYLFNGKELDEETGLYYYGARYYDPQTSVWLSVDPLAEKYPGWSPYNYTLNDPISLVDPDGNSPNGPKPNVIPIILSLNRKNATIKLGFSGSYRRPASKEQIDHVISRAKRLKAIDNINSLAGSDGGPPILGLLSQGVAIAINYGKADILQEARAIDSQNRNVAIQAKQIETRTKFAINTLKNLDIANSEGVFGKKIDDNTLLNLANYAIFSEFSDPKAMQFYNGIFKGQGDVSKGQYLKQLNSLYNKYQNAYNQDKHENSRGSYNVSNLDGPPILIDKVDVRKYHNVDESSP